MGLTPTAPNGHRATGDDGLFGPESVTWRIMAEPVLWVAGFRALYLQALHPRVMRGTWQNTAFTDPKQAWGRFLRTSEFVRVRTYGSLAEVDTLLQITLRLGYASRELVSHAEILIISTRQLLERLIAHLRSRADLPHHRQRKTDNG